MWIPTLHEIPDHCKGVAKEWEGLNPDWTVMTWDEQKAIDLMVGFCPELIKHYRKIKLPIKRADFARLVVLLKYGGLYIDFDIKPLRPLAAFFSDPWILARKRYMPGTIPRFITRERTDFTKKELILTREYRLVDGFSSVCNGVLFSMPENPLLGEVLFENAPNYDAEVLNYLGPHALTEHLRRKSRAELASTLILPPYYFIWEDRAFTHKAPPWVVAKHLAINSWGDHRKKGKWWQVT